MAKETAEAGHNSGVAAAELKEFVRRLQRVEDEKKEAVAEHNEMIKEIKAEAKGRGYDVGTLTLALKLYRMEDDKKEMLDLYCNALDIFG